MLAREPTAHHVCGETVPLTNLTEPSHIRTLAPPEWRLRRAVGGLTARVVVAAVAVERVVGRHDVDVPRVGRRSRRPTAPEASWLSSEIAEGLFGRANVLHA